VPVQAVRRPSCPASHACTPTRLRLGSCTRGGSLLRPAAFDHSPGVVTCFEARLWNAAACRGVRRFVTKGKKGSCKKVRALSQPRNGGIPTSLSEVSLSLAASLSPVRLRKPTRRVTPPQQEPAMPAACRSASTSSDVEVMIDCDGCEHDARQRLESHLARPSKHTALVVVR